MLRRSLWSLQSATKVSQVQRSSRLFHNSKYQFSAGSEVAKVVVPNELGEQVAKITELASYSVKIDDMSLFTNSYTGDMDVSNILEATKPLSGTIPHDFIDKLSGISPGSLYTHMDEFSRDAMLYLANDLGWGLGLSIAALSLGIKVVFMPLMFGAQLNGLRMKLLEPETKNYQAQLTRLQKQGDYNAVKEAQRQYSLLQKRHGVRNWMAVAALSQMPVLITWFISLRYVTSMPDKFPQLRTEGLLWFQDLAEQDPYCILPVMSALFSFWNISMNPNMGNMASSSPFQKYMKYFKYFPFLTMPIVIFFPSALNMYWAISAATHLFVAMVIRNPTGRSFFGVPKYLPGTILDKQNQESVQKVIKAVITDNRIVPNIAADTQKISATLASAAAASSKPQSNIAQPFKVNAEATKQFFANNKPHSPSASTEKKLNPTTGTQQVFTNKPPKKK